MQDLLEQGSAWLERQRHKHMTRTVTYQRGGSSVELAATIGRTVFDTTDEFGVVQKIESRDFLVRTEDLVLEGQATLPKRGDQIREPQDRQVFVYEVMAPGSKPHFRYADPYRHTFRVHTKHISTENE